MRIMPFKNILALNFIILKFKIIIYYYNYFSEMIAIFSID